jgi:hypothetical protein
LFAFSKQSHFYAFVRTNAPVICGGDECSYKKGLFPLNMPRLLMRGYFLPDILKAGQTHPVFKLDSACRAGGLAKTAAEAFHLVDISFFSGNLELDGPELAPLNTDTAAGAFIVVELGYPMTLDAAYFDAVIHAGPDRAAVRIVAIADTAYIRAAEGHQDVNHTFFVPFEQPFLSFVHGHEINPAFVSLGPALPLEHAHAKTGAGVFVVVSFLLGPGMDPADTGHGGNGERHFGDLVGLLNGDDLPDLEGTGTAHGVGLFDQALKFFRVFIPSRKDLSHVTAGRHFRVRPESRWFLSRLFNLVHVAGVVLGIKPPLAVPVFRVAVRVTYPAHSSFLLKNKQKVYQKTLVLLQMYEPAANFAAIKKT